MNKKLLILLIAILTIDHSLFTRDASAQSANWTAVSPSVFPTNASGQIHGISRVSQLKFHPTNSLKMYAVSARGGLFISVDGGNNWTIAPGCDPMPSNRFASVCIDHTNDQIIYLGAGDHNYYSSGTGVWKSTNGGTTFTQTSLNNKIVVELVMDPTNNQVIVAATNTGIYKTINGGTTWILKSTSRAFDDMKMKANTASRTLFAATRDTGFFRSIDFGETWSQINTGIVLPSGITNGGGCRIAVTPADSNYVYFGMVTTGGIIYRSTNGGTNFSLIKTSGSPYLTYYTNSVSDPGQGDYNFGIGVDRVNKDIVYLCAHANWKSTNGGTSWTQLTDWWAKCHTDMHQVFTNPYNNAQLWNVNDGGLFLSTDGGSNWTPKSDGINGYEIYHGSCSPTRKDMYSIGTQDNGELYATASGWFTNRGGDWQSRSSFDFRANSSMVYYYQPDWGTVPTPKRRLVTGSESTYGLPVTTMTAIAFYRGNTSLAFVGSSNIYRTTNLSVTTPTWTQISTFSKTIMAVHVHYGDANRVYVITNDAMIYVTTNALAATPTWTSYTLPNTTNNAANITSIKSQLNTIYITANTKAYKSTDNGATWTDNTYNLPAVNHVDIIADEYYSSNQLVFVASNNAVYYKTGSATTWSIYSTNLPSRTSIVDMGIYNDSTSNTTLRVFTYGRGTWETSISNLRALNANFVASNTTPCVGQAITFIDNSTGSVTSRTWTFAGGTPATSTAANPTVTYSAAGIYSVTLTVSNGTTNSTLTQTNYISTVGNNLNVTENYEGGSFPSAGWTNIDVGNNSQAWTLYNGAGGFGTSNNCMYFSNYSWNVAGAKDELYSPKLNTASYNSLTLTFDVAYQPYSLTSYIDSLQVLVSTDCGNTFSPIYTKWGNTLNTTGIVSTASFIPTAAQWRTETLNLNAYIGQSIIVSFRNIGRYGNNTYIDNINFNGTVLANAGTDAIICSGNSASIGMTDVSGINYSWLPTAGLSSANVSNPTASPTATTTYTLTSTHSSSGITATDNVVVTLSPLPTPSTLTAGGPTTFCSGDNVLLSGNSTNGTWSIGGGTTSTLTATTTGDYFTTTTNSCGSIESNHISVTVNPLPVASSLTAGGPTIFCSGGNVLLSGNSTGGTWSIGGGTSASTIASTSGDYFVTTTNACGSIESNHINVNVGTLSVSGSNSTVNCFGGNNADITLTLNPSTGNTYNWSNGATTQNITVLSAGNYSVTVTNANGCSHNQSFTITQPTLVSGSATGSTLNCGNTNGTASATASGGTAPYNYAWSNGATTQNLSAISTGIYSVTITDANACNTISSATVSAGGSAPSVVLNSVNASCGQSNGSVINSITGGTSPFLYSWSNGATTQNLTNVVAANYSVIVTDTLGCTDSSASTVLSTGTVPAQPTFSVTKLLVCRSQSGFIYSVNSVSDATSYLWAVSSGATISSGQGTSSVSIAFSSSATSSSISCIALNGCGNSVAASFAYNVVTVKPGTPGVIAGNIVNCINTTATFSVSPVANTTTYTWIAPANTTILSGQGTTTILLSFGPAWVSGTLSINASNCIGVSANRTKALASKPGTPVSIIGPIAGVCSGVGVVYSTAAVANATSYNWVAPANATIITGQGTNSITINFNAAYITGSISVTANNQCGASTARAVTIKSAPATPGTITGLVNNICNSGNLNYSIPLVSGATNYTWAVTGGASIISGQGTTSVSIAFNVGFSVGNITVYAGNTCGNSSTKTLTVYGRPATPGTITGSATVCVNQSGVNYSIAAVTGATNYTWTAPAGATISTGQGTNAAIVNFGATAGNVSVTANNACATSLIKSKAITMNCKLEKVIENYDVQLFPNPTEDFATVRFNSNESKTAVVEVKNIIGQIMFSKQFDLTYGANEIILEFKHYAKGTYIIHLKMNDAVIAKKIEIQ